MNGKWIGFKTDQNFDESNAYIPHGAEAPYFRKKFSLAEKKIEKATLKITSLGIFKAFINGKEVGDEYFAPGWTNYAKRILLMQYDVTDMLEKDNAIAVCVGDGWYVGYLCILGRNRYGKYPLELYAELIVRYEDGSEEKIVTDESWLGGKGAIGFNDFLYGEEYDARLPHAECSTVGFDDEEWGQVCVCEDKSERLSVFDCPPVRIFKTLTPVFLHTSPKGDIYDVKQNIAGFLRIRCKGARGAKIVMRHGEMLNEDGTLYTDNLRTAQAKDTYILRGDGVEEYAPTFTYHGFRYVEISVEGEVESLELTACALTSDLPQTGSVETSNEIANQLFSNIMWSQRDNFIELPTDCPQRNERLGWSADTQVFSRSGMYNTDAEVFYEKQMMRIDDDRRGGKIADVVPYFGVAPFDSCGWRDVVAVVPYNLWKMYGNLDVVRKYKPMLEEFVDRQMETAKDYVWEEAYYGDWLNVDDESDHAALATATQALSVKMIAELFEAAGFGGEKYFSIYEKIKAAFRKEFVGEKGKIKSDSQSLYCIAYQAGLIDGEEAAPNLYEALKRKNFHIHSGFLGIRFILPTLCDLGMKDVAYTLLTNTSYPSWGYSIVNGATTIWERWNSYTINSGFADKTMNSFNHYSLGSCGEWYYEYMLGIKPLKEGFEKLQIKPYIDGTGKITFAKGYYESRKGKISVEWKREGDTAEIVVEKPAELYTEFCFEKVERIEQDGKFVAEFDPYAKMTKVLIRV
ncbi:MAG: family 78 glycoside hydrolase catalytic domain [Clostridia bacterium]|nr:family 78 glycoside hydrolase catalytic domain [Clostridia bacterium]